MWGSGTDGSAMASLRSAASLLEFAATAPNDLHLFLNAAAGYR
jgi:hypothetical protein